MKALYVQMMELYPILQFVKGRCHGNQIIMGETRNNEGGLIPRAFFALAFENELEYQYLCAH